MHSPSPSEYTAISRLLKAHTSEMTRSVFILDAYLESRPKRVVGPDYHKALGEWLASGLTAENDLFQWLQESFSPRSVRRGHFDRARSRAERRQKNGFWTASWREPFQPSDTCQAHPCPQLVFGTGDLAGCHSWTAVFNSRKPKIVSPHEEWLAALRSFLPIVAEAGNSGIAGSSGTITYDMVTAYAQQARLPLFVVAPFPIEAGDQEGSKTIFDGKPPPTLFLTCLTKAVSCSKALRMACRDRLLALLSDVHLILELRRNGNLQALLSDQQTHHPRRQWVLCPERRTAQNAGNFELIERFPEWSKPLPRVDTGISPSEPPGPAAGRLPQTVVLKEVRWEDYLYHYTRSCPGPWPGQSYREYLLSLFGAEALCGHMAVDTLARILREGRIRAGTRLIRGSQAALSWTAHPPREMEAIRWWNKALIRWTFEPYGFAVSRGLLRRRGARPAVYARSEDYERIKVSERFRFQRHEAPQSLWKHEREWRMPGDLILAEVAEGEGFVFVPDTSDLKRLIHSATLHLPIVVLSQINDHGRIHRCNS